MNVRLVSQDRRLHDICRALGDELPGCTWDLASDRNDLISDADLYIWDFDPEIPLPAALRQNLCRHLFLVDRKDMAPFGARLARANANILLKPVTRATLAAFVGLAVSVHADRISSANVIRADRDEMLQWLIQTNLKLQEVDQERTNFLARALHDFRSPLTAISGYCDLLVNDVLGPLREEQKEVLRKMSDSTQRLTRLTCAMFELSVGQQAHLPLDSREADIEECIDKAVSEAQPVAAAKGISITTMLERPAGSLFFDPALIGQVLVKLLENACKFTSKAGTVELAGYPYFWERRRATAAAPRTGDRRKRFAHTLNAYRVDILNRGLPIPEERLHEIFEEYTSYGGGNDRSGGGLSLAICKMVINRHDGRIWAENRDTGPAFSFVLPLRAATVAMYGKCDISGGYGE